MHDEIALPRTGSRSRTRPRRHLHRGQDLDSTQVSDVPRRGDRRRSFETCSGHEAGGWQIGAALGIAILADVQVSLARLAYRR